MWTLSNLAGAVRDVFQIAQHPFEECFLADAVWGLIGLGVVGFDDEAVEGGKECEGFAAGGDVAPKSLGAGCAVVTALTAVIHILPFR